MLIHMTSLAPESHYAAASRQPLSAANARVLAKETKYADLWVRMQAAVILDPSNGAELGQQKRQRHGVWCAHHWQRGSAKLTS